MKQKKAAKKLTLNKATVADLKHFELKNAKGGTLHTSNISGPQCCGGTSEPETVCGRSQVGDGDRDCALVTALDCP